jgi:hypothetical protein
MTSQVNPNNIDGTYPVAGQDNDSQGFRDNFTNIRNNFTYIKAEIEDLQNKSVLKTNLNNSTLNNDFLGNAIVNASLTGWRETYNNIGSVSGSITVDFANGNYQKIVLNGATTLNFSFPSNTNGQIASIKLWVNFPVADPARTLAFANAPSLGDADTIAGYNAGTITFSSAELANNTDYLFEIWTPDAGTTLGIKDLVRNRDIDLSGMSITGNLALDNISASGNVVTTNGIFWSGNGQPFSPSGATGSFTTLVATGNIVAASTANNVSDGDTTVGSFISKGSAGVVGNLNINGNLWVTSGNIRTTASTANIFNFSGATINIGNATPNIFMGLSTGNVTIGGNLIAGANSRATSFVPTSTSIPAYGIYSPSAGAIGFSTNFTPNWLINVSGTLLPQTDNTFDIGNGLVNPRDITASRTILGKANVTATGNLTTAGGRINSNYAYVTLTNNQNFYANATTTLLFFDTASSATIANARIALPAGAEDGREISINVLAPVTALWINKGNTADVKWSSNTIASSGNVALKFVWSQANSNWLRSS